MKVSYLYPLFFVFFLFSGSCVFEKDEPPGCTTPEMPAIVAGRTEFTEGEDIVLDAQAPAGAQNGAFEWQGPNRYFITQQHLVIKNAKELNEGEYKVFYLNEGRCRSKPVSVNVTVFSFSETCGLRNNTIRHNGNDIAIANLQEGTEANGNFSVNGSSDSVQVKIIFPVKTRPTADRSYIITANTGSRLEPNELDILVTINGRTYHAMQSGNSTVKTFLLKGNLHIAFCGYTFATNGGNNLMLSGNIVSGQ